MRIKKGQNINVISTISGLYCSNLIPMDKINADIHVNDESQWLMMIFAYLLNALLKLFLSVFNA